ncbi:gluconokinase [Agromyces endophyticus]|uniref:gluconokinase n=1 Tax=Agromyces sp. H17E-10 TaxID=2932244 RepID=UPI001FD12C69|nr:gluconokinase [Agromyces sp. H17E-10]UOQ91305.1 gluconokinase [Agromyces sp. H17E-10]
MTERIGATGADPVAPVPPAAIVVMGVAGAGKSTLAAALADRIDGVFIEADDLHSPEAKAQMAAGIPLTDDDRWPWLARVAARAHDEHAEGRAIVVSCSALKRRYREFLIRASETDLAFVHVHGTEAELTERITKRTGHFMPASMLASQLEALEPLAADERGFVVPHHLPVTEAVEVALRNVAAAGAGGSQLERDRS